MLQELLWKINHNSKAKSQCLTLQKESYLFTSQKEAPTTTENKYSNIHLVNSEMMMMIIIIINAAVFQLDYFL